MNFGNFNPFKKTEAKSSVTEKAKDLAGDAAKLSAAAMALAGMLDATNVDAKNTYDKDQTPANKIEMSTQQSTQEMSGKTISWEDAQTIHHEIDSIQSLNKNAESAEKFFKTKINATLGQLEKLRQSLPNQDKTQGMYQDIIEYIYSSSDNYDLSTQEGLQKFQDHMIESAFDASYFKTSNPKLAEKLVAYGLSFNKIGNPNTITQLQHELINKVAAQISVENYKEVQDHEIAMRKSKLDSSNNNQITASK